MIIAQISDTHIALDTPDADRRLQDFEATIADINGLSQTPDVIVHTGDIVQNGLAEEYQAAADILKKAKAPVYLMVGNKDDRAVLRDEFPEARYLHKNSEFISYSVEDFPVRLIMLDTLNPGSNKGELCEKRQQEFAELVGTDLEKPIAVFAHHPPFVVDEGPEPLHFGSDDNLNHFRGALMAIPSINGVFCGHVHRAVTGMIGTTPALVMTSTATVLRWGNYPQSMKDCPVYQVHHHEPKWGFTSRTEVVPS